LHRRILSIKAGFDGMAIDLEIGLGHAQPLTFGHTQMQGNKVESGDRLGNRMLDLNAWIDFQEEIFLTGDKKFNRAQAAIRQRFTQPHGVMRDLVEQRPGQTPGGGFLDDFLMPPLQCAVALEQMNDMPLAIPSDLNLDMAGARQKAFEEQAL